MTYGPAHVTERGKYLNVWTQVNGSWKIKANIVAEWLVLRRHPGAGAIAA